MLRGETGKLGKKYIWLLLYERSAAMKQLANLSPAAIK